MYLERVYSDKFINYVFDNQVKQQAIFYAYNISEWGLHDPTIPAPLANELVELASDIAQRHRFGCSVSPDLVRKFLSGMGHGMDLELKFTPQGHFMDFTCTKLPEHINHEGGIFG